MTSTVIHGVTFDDSTDWIAWLREVAKGGPRRELRNDLTTPAAVSELASQLPDALASRLADAGLALLEHGTPAERDVVRGLRLARARDAANRIMAVIRSKPDELAKQQLLDPLFYAVVGLAPSDPVLHDLLVRELDANRGARSSAIAYLAQTAHEWIVANVERLRAEPDEMVDAFVATPVAVRSQLLDALATDDARIDALWQGVTDPSRLAPTTAARFTNELAAHPRFAARRPRQD